VVTRIGLRATNSPKDTAENPVACDCARFFRLFVSHAEKEKKTRYFRRRYMTASAIAG